MVKNNKFFGIILSLIILISIFFSVNFIISQNHSNENYPDLKIAVTAGEISSIIHVAYNKSLFIQNFLNASMKEYLSGILALNSVIDKENDVATVADYAFVNPSYLHPDLRIIGTIATSQLTEIIARKDHGIKIVSDLKNKTIGVPFGTNAQYYLGQFLILNNLTNTNIIIKNIFPNQLEPSLKNGSIDAFAGWAPFIYYSKNSLGNNSVSWNIQNGLDSYFIVVTREDVILNNKKGIDSFVECLIKAEKFIFNNYEETKVLITNKFNYSIEYMNYILNYEQYIVILPQSLILTLEDQANFNIFYNITSFNYIHNFLDFIYPDSLLKYKSEGVSLIGIRSQ